MGTGPLPEWLRWKRGMVALDSYEDNLCLFRCLAVSRGCTPDRSTNRARKLAASFYERDKALPDVPETSLDQLGKIEEHFKTGIQVYEPTECGDWHLTRQAAQYDEKVSIGIYGEHAFLIKDIRKLANVYYCGACKARFTKAVSLQCHVKRCMTG